MLESPIERPNCHRPMEPGYLTGRGLGWHPPKQGQNGPEYSEWQSWEFVYPRAKLPRLEPKPPLSHRCVACRIYWLGKSEE